ncbi:VOC family protein [Bacillus sp. AK031]
MIFEMTYQVRVEEFSQAVHWYKTLLNKEPDFAPHENFAEWKILPGCWIQVSRGKPSQGSGPIRLGVYNIEEERKRLLKEFQMVSFEINSREEVPVKWATFQDPWGNQIGFFEYLNEEERDLKIDEVLGGSKESW